VTELNKWLSSDRPVLFFCWCMQFTSVRLSSHGLVMMFLFSALLCSALPHNNNNINNKERERERERFA
jgi:hypothetical protein